jgi:hypothetical protein
MCIATKALQLGVPMMTAVHVARVIIPATTIALMFKAGASRRACGAPQRTTQLIGRAWHHIDAPRPRTLRIVLGFKALVRQQRPAARFSADRQRTHHNLRHPSTSEAFPT